MTVRVDLLKPSEFRRQGAVSGAFIVRVSIASILAFGGLFALLAFVRFRIARQDLLACREIWKMREPLYNQIMDMKQDLATEKKIQQELVGWEDVRIDWEPALLGLQGIVPSTMQLRRLNVRGEQNFRREKVPDGEGEVEVPVRRFFLVVEGKATGDKAEDLVVQFVRAMGKEPVFAPILESIKLQSLQRDTSQRGEQFDRMFRVEATTVARAMK